MNLWQVGVDKIRYAAAATQVTTAAVRLRLRQEILAWKIGGGGATAAVDKQLGSCAAGNMKDTALCVQL